MRNILRVCLRVAACSRRALSLAKEVEELVSPRKSKRHIFRLRTAHTLTLSGSRVQGAGNIDIHTGSNYGISTYSMSNEKRQAASCKSTDTDGSQAHQAARHASHCTRTTSSTHTAARSTTHKAQRKHKAQSTASTHQITNKADLDTHEDRSSQYRMHGHTDTQLRPAPGMPTQIHACSTHMHHVVTAWRRK